jgi:hypothetical protein
MFPAAHAYSLRLIITIIARRWADYELEKLPAGCKLCQLEISALLDGDSFGWWRGGLPKPSQGPAASLLIARLAFR